MIYYHIKNELDEKGINLAAEDCGDEDIEEYNDLKTSLS